MFEAAGRMLGKAVFERIAVPAPLCPSVFKFLLGLQPSLHDLEVRGRAAVQPDSVQAYDSELGQQLRALLRMADVSALYLDFADICPPGPKADRPLDNDNRQEYVMLRVASVLEGRRQAELEALRRGVLCLPMRAHLQLLAPNELMGIVQVRSCRASPHHPARARSTLRRAT